MPKLGTAPMHHTHHLLVATSDKKRVRTLHYIDLQHHAGNAMNEMPGRFDDLRALECCESD